MSLKKNVPTLSDDRKNGSCQPQQRALAANHDAKQLLAYLQEQKAKIPEIVLEFIKNIEATTEVFITNPLGGDLQKTVEDAVTKATLDIKKDIHAIKTNTENQFQSPSGRVKSFAEALRQAQAPPPLHYQSNHGSNSSQGATPSELSRDREIVVKLGDAAGIKKFRSLTSADIRKRAQQARDKTCMGTLNQLPLGAVQFVAARQLKSGDLSLSLRSAKEAELVRLHRNWVRGLWPAATVCLSSWGVVVHGIPVKAMGDLSDSINQKAITMQLIAENNSLWGKNIEILHIGWLAAPPENKKLSSIVIEFNKPQIANNVIDKGTIWDLNLLNTELYNRAAHFRQCFNCQKYGHIGSTCPNKTACVYCAGQHQIQVCTRKQDQQSCKCANCGCAYPAWLKNCEFHQREVERVENTLRYRPRYHRVPAYMAEEPARDIEGSVSSGSEPSSTAPTNFSSTGKSNQESTDKATSQAPSERTGVEETAANQAATSQVSKDSTNAGVPLSQEVVIWLDMEIEVASQLEREIEASSTGSMAMGLQRSSRSCATTSQLILRATPDQTKRILQASSPAKKKLKMSKVPRNRLTARKRGMPIREDSDVELVEAPNSDKMTIASLRLVG